MAEFAARRARGILARLDEDIARRHRIVRELLDSVGDLPAVFSPGPEDTASFLLIESEKGRATNWVEKAAREGVTLRLSWPAYQNLEEGQGSEQVDWMAEHLLIAEVHPNLRTSEVRRIAEVIKRIAAEGDRDPEVKGSA